MQQWTPKELATHLAQTELALQILDVREQWEYQIACLPNSICIPLGQLFLADPNLTKQTPLVVVCHHGIRSAHAGYFLERLGYQVINLTGGIDRWARELDPDMPIY